MAKNKIEIDVEVKDKKGSTKKLGLESKKTAKSLDEVGKSSRTADRNLKGAAQASSGAGKNFSKMSQGMGGLVGAYATLAASMFALSAAFEFFKNASDLKVLEQSQLQFAQSTGVAMTSLTNSLRAASKGMLNFQQAASSSAMGLAKGFSADQMNKIADGALKVSNVLGRNFTDSFDRLVRGISKAEPELLDELGITLRLETATKAYADAMGMAADSLTTADKSQAVYLETMKQLNKVVADQEGMANPFIQLGATFSDLAKTISGFLLPPFEALAGFMNRNAAVALLFFGSIGLGILKNMPFIGEMGASMTAFFDGQKQKAGEASTALDQYQKEIEETRQAAASIREEGATEVKSGAGKAVKKGATSPVLQRAASGTMKGPDKSNLKKALKSAEAEYAKTGRVTKGIFKDVGIDIARSIGKGLQKTEKKARTTGQKMGRFFKRIQLRAKKTGAVIKGSLAKGLDKAGKAAKGLGKAMNMAMKATVILAVIQMIFDLTMKLINAPKDVMDGIVKVVGGAMKFIQAVVNGAIFAINYVIENANKIPGVDIGLIGKATFGDEAAAGFKKMVEGSDLYAKATVRQAAAEKKAGFLETLKETKEQATELGKELDIILAGRVFDEKRETFDPMKAARARAEAIKSLPVLDLMRNADTLKGTDKYKEALDAIIDKMGGMKKLSPQLAAAIKAGNTDVVETLTLTAGRYGANLDGATDKLANLSIATKGKGVEAVRLYIQEISDMGAAAVQAGEELGLTTDILDKLNERFEDAGGIKNYIRMLQAVENESRRISFGQNDNKMAGLLSGSNLNKGSNTENQKTLVISNAQYAVDEKLNNLVQLNNQALLLTTDLERDLHTKAVENATREIALSETKLQIAKDNANELKQLGKGIGDSLESSLNTAMNALVQGTMSMKQAFASMAKSILADISKMIVKMLVFRMLQSAFGGTGFGDFLGIKAPQERYGGIVEQGKQVPGYATGGIAKGSTSGYPAILHGTEAVVPLGSGGRSIPVDLKGSGGSTNNIVVNISTEGQSSKEGSSGPDMDKLGTAVATAVQVELQNQKRSGGILNPYGVA